MASPLAWRIYFAVRWVFVMIPPAVLMSLIVLDYIAFIQVFASPLMDTKPVASVILTMMLSVTALLLLASYVRCISADNTIPLDPFFQTILQNRPSSEYCRQCKAWRLPRSHHCSVCGRCTALMDHHCIWVANCVGEQNYKYFMLFLVYSCVSSYIFLIGLMGPLWEYFNRPEKKMSETEYPVWAIIPAFITFSFALSLSCFVVFHLNLIFKGQTTLEHRLRLRDSEADHLRDRTLRQRWCLVFGRSPWYWFLPVAAPPPVKDFLLEASGRGEAAPLSTAVAESDGRELVTIEPVPNFSALADEQV